MLCCLPPGPTTATERESTTDNTDERVWRPVSGEEASMQFFNIEARCLAMQSTVSCSVGSRWRGHRWRRCPFAFQNSDRPETLNHSETIGWKWRFMHYLPLCPLLLFSSPEHPAAISCLVKYPLSHERKGHLLFLSLGKSGVLAVFILNHLKQHP
jgi:hypothetical protein